jgi:hypothetical protein
VIRPVRTVSGWRALGSAGKIPAHKRDSRRTPFPGRHSERMRPGQQNRTPTAPPRDGGPDSFRWERTDQYRRTPRSALPRACSGGRLTGSMRHRPGHNRVNVASCRAGPVPGGAGGPSGYGRDASDRPPPARHGGHPRTPRQRPVRRSPMHASARAQRVTCAHPLAPGAAAGYEGLPARTTSTAPMVRLPRRRIRKRP